MGCWSLTARASSFSVVALALAAVSCRSIPLAVYGTVPEFTLTSQSGQTFQGSSLDGSVWVADFFFTHCTGPCPRMSSRFRHIEKTFADQNDLKLVSFTVDPKRDTPEVLAAYSRLFSAEPGRWFFLTGPVEELNRMSMQVFMLGTVGEDFNHSTRFVLVDRRRRIRGFYQSNDTESMQKLMQDIRSVLQEKI